jgi:hypothetical protein
MYITNMGSTIPQDIYSSSTCNAAHNWSRNPCATQHKTKALLLYFPSSPSIDNLAAPISVDAAPNTNVGYHDIGLPGSLPVLNKQAVMLAVKAALALGCKVNKRSSFDRKHFFYKDLATGYQITQKYRTFLKYSV